MPENNEEIRDGSFMQDTSAFAAFALKQLEQFLRDYNVPYLFMDRFSVMDDIEEPDAAESANAAERFIYRPMSASYIGDVEKYCVPEVVYSVIDHYGMERITFIIPESLWPRKTLTCMAIGPYLTEEADTVLAKYAEGSDKPLDDFMKGYIESATYLHDGDVFRSAVVSHIDSIYGGRHSTSVNRIYDLNWPLNQERMEGQTGYSAMKEDEEYIRHEDLLLESVRQNNVDAAMTEYAWFQVHHIRRGMNDSLAALKGRMSGWNALMRREVIAAGVHPSRAMNVYLGMEGRIESSIYQGELYSLMRDMIADYCKQTENNTHQVSSALIRDTLNYIDLNIRHPLSLSSIAAVMNVNASYLSGLFRREEGCTLTDYINNRRIETSQMYLATTDKTVAWIAEHVGIADSGYYARLFKKYKQMTPGEYRAMMKGKEKAMKSEGGSNAD